MGMNCTGGNLKGAVDVVWVTCRSEPGLMGKNCTGEKVQWMWCGWHAGLNQDSWLRTALVERCSGCGVGGMQV